MKKRQRLVNQVNGIDDYDNPLYQPLQDTEYNAELYYGVHVTDWLTVRPNLHGGSVGQRRGLRRRPGLPVNGQNGGTP